ncbi:amidase [Arthrobacter sp. NPDC093139]|uniref:amidase n=1 Tax=Arthrobacter sp. NPDC093139 TaxID=3363945 RepID=UPI00381A1087
MSKQQHEHYLHTVADQLGLDDPARYAMWWKRVQEDNTVADLLREVALARTDLPIRMGDLSMEAPLSADLETAAGRRSTRESQSVTRHESTVARVAQFLEIIEQKSDLNAFTCVFAESALEAAEKVDGLIAAGTDPGPLAGKVVAVKDLIEVEGYATTAGTKAYRSPTATRDADVVARLREAGAVIIGMTNLHALAYGAMSNSGDWGAVGNPLRGDTLSGGSSGGSATAVAAGMVDIALGTDTAGSIRIPASLCGVVGLKPTYGRISTKGVHPLAPSLDHVGPITRTVADSALVMQVLTGWDATWRRELLADLKGVVVGLPHRFFFDHLEEEVRTAVDHAVDSLQELGATIHKVDIPTAQYSPAAGLCTIAPEALDIHLSLLQERGHLLPDDVRLRLEAGMFRTGADYSRAQRIRAKMQAELANALAQADVLLTPTLAVTAPHSTTQHLDVEGARWPVQQALTRLTSPFNLTGYPALSLPWGNDRLGGSIGIQLVAQPMAEDRLLSIAAVLEAHGRDQDEPGVILSPAAEA